MYEERCNIKIHTFQAFDGDSFLVTICESEKEINILIDCGNQETYQNYIKPHLLHMSEQGKKINFLILTHVHSDHIGGAIPLLVENRSFAESCIIEIEHVIYNGYLGLELECYPSLDCTAKEQRMCQGILAQGRAVSGRKQTEKQITLNEELCISHLLIQGGYKWNVWDDDKRCLIIADTHMKIDIGEHSYIQFISPNKQQLIQMNKKWEAYLKRIYRKVLKIDNEIVRNAYEAFQWIVNNANYDTIQELITSKALNKESVEKMANMTYSYDYTEENKESIAFVLSVKNKKVLFLGDANIEICRKNLKKIYGLNPIEMELIKLSHHGSKRNISNHFLEQFGSRSYLISAGMTDLRPSMETIAKLLVNRPKEQKNIYITNKNSTIECFDTDNIHNAFMFEFVNIANSVIEI